MPVQLEEILSSTRRTLPALHARRGSFERDLQDSDRSPPSFRGALLQPRVAVIAELKRRSPSVGAIKEDLDPAERASLYATSGAAALSVLTDGPYFGGSMEDLRTAADNCSLPVLRKDFILDEVQLLEARAAGASAVLLIVRVLGTARLRPLLRFSAQLGLDALVEVHTRAEVDQALQCEADIVGINSRDLDTFTIDVEAAWKLLERIPGDRVAVAESGIAERKDVALAAAAGADAVLVGTALSASGSPGQLIHELSSVRRHGR
jgi:indole-3-glycerol phosphate synthase